MATSWIIGAERKRVCRLLQGRSAEELFRISARTLEKLLGRDAGNRLHSLLTVARNLSGYTLGRSQELAAILKVRKEQTEVDGGPSGGGGTRRSNENNADCNNTYDVIPEPKVSNVSEQC